MRIENSKWRLVKLGDIFKISSGGTPLKSKPEYYENGTIRWVRTGDLKNKYITKIKGLITEEALNNSSAKLFPFDTVLIAMYGATIGACSILSVKAATNQACAAFLPNKEVQSSYLYYFFCSKKNDFIKMGVGGAQPNISATILKGVQMPLPPLETQKQIAKTLDTTAELLAMRKQQHAELDNLIKSTFYDMFGDPVTNEKGWKRQQLSRCCSINPRKSEIDYFTNDFQVSFVAMPSVSANGDIDTSQIRDYKEVNTGFTYFYENDVLFAKITPCMENGKGAIARSLKNNIGFGSTEFHVLRAIEGVSNSEWLYRLTTLPIFRENAEKNMSGSAGQKRVPTSFFDKFMVSLPPLSLQTQFGQIVTKIEEQKALVKMAIDETQVLFDSLMSEYFE